MKRRLFVAFLYPDGYSRIRICSMYTNLEVSTFPFRLHSRQLLGLGGEDCCALSPVRLSGMSSKKQAQDDDDDFYDDSGILDMIPEPDDGVEQDASSEEGVDEDFLNELGKAKATPFKRPLKYFVFLLKGKAQKGVRIINLPHPKTGACFSKASLSIEPLV